MLDILRVSPQQGRIRPNIKRARQECAADLRTSLPAKGSSPIPSGKRLRRCRAAADQGLSQVPSDQDKVRSLPPGLPWIGARLHGQGQGVSRRRRRPGTRAEAKVLGILLMYARPPSWGLAKG